MLKHTLKPYSPVPAQDEKQVALRYILEAWEEAVYDGIDPDCIAESFKAQGSEITWMLTLGFLVAGLYFVWRSFYGMRIQSGN